MKFHTEQIKRVISIMLGYALPCQSKYLRARVALLKTLWPQLRDKRMFIFGNKLAGSTGQASKAASVLSKVEPKSDHRCGAHSSLATARRRWSCPQTSRPCTLAELDMLMLISSQRYRSFACSRSRERL